MQTIDQGTGVIETEHSALIKLDTARMLLAEARDLNDIKQVRDMAEAARLYAREHKLGLEAQNSGAEIAIRAARRIGEIIPETFTQGASPGTNNRKTVKSPRVTLEDAGISRNQSVKWQKLAEIDEDEFDAYIGETVDANKELTMAGALKLVKAKKLVQKRNSHDAQAQAEPIKPIVVRASWSEWLTEQPDCDLLLTDPPYATDVDDIQAFANAWLPVALSAVKRTGRAYVCIGAYPEELRAYLNADHADLELAQVLVWTYRNTKGPTSTFDYQLNWQAILYFRGSEAPSLDCPDLNEQEAVLSINAPDGRLGNRYHAWQKPDALAERLIRHSTKPGDQGAQR